YFSRVLDTSTPTTRSSINLGDELSVGIDITAIHSGSVKRERDLAVFVDRDHSTGPAKFCDFIDHRDARLLHRFPAVFNQGRDIMRGGSHDEKFAVTGTG